MKKIFWTMLLQLTIMQAFSQPVIYTISNCDGESRTVLFHNQVSNAMYCAKGDFSFKKNSSLKFSPDSKINLDNLDKAAIPFQKAFPKGYWNHNIGAAMLHTKPNEDGRIWFEQVYVEEDGKGNIKPIAALKVVFEGSSAEKERVSPKIQNIIITSDPKVLKKYIAVIQRLKITNNVTTPTVIGGDEDAPPPLIRN